MPTCRLCGHDNPLIDAHVIPRAFYPERAPEGDAVLIGDGYPRRVPVGIYDKTILCAGCDNDLGQLDDHAASHLLRGAPQPAYGQHVRHYIDADAATLLRFIASVAWRASISSHSMFARAGLGPYEASARAMVDGDFDRKPSLEIMIAEFDLPRPPFLGPYRSRLEGVSFVLIYASRFVFYVKTDKLPMPTAFTQLTLKPGKPVLSLVREWHSSNEKRAMNEMVFANPLMSKTLQKWGWRAGR